MLNSLQNVGNVNTNSNNVSFKGSYVKPSERLYRRAVLNTSQTVSNDGVLSVFANKVAKLIAKHFPNKINYTDVVIPKNAKRMKDGTFHTVQIHDVFYDKSNRRYEPFFYKPFLGIEPSLESLKDTDKEVVETFFDPKTQTIKKVIKNPKINVQVVCERTVPSVSDPKIYKGKITYSSLDGKGDSVVAIIDRSIPYDGYSRYGHRYDYESIFGLRECQLLDENGNLKEKISAPDLNRITGSYGEYGYDSTLIEGLGERRKDVVYMWNVVRRYMEDAHHHFSYDWISAHPYHLDNMYNAKLLS